MIKQQQPGWFTKKQIMEFLNVTDSMFKRSVIQGLGAEHIDDSRREHTYYGRGVFENWAKRRYDKKDDELNVGDAKSPSLERGRHYRALIAKADYEERISRLIPVDVLQKIFGLMERMLQDIRKRLELEYGEKAGEIINQGIEEFDKRINEYIETVPEHETEPSNGELIESATNDTTAGEEIRREIEEE